MTQYHQIQHKKIDFTNVNKRLLILNGVLLVLFLVAQMFITTNLGTKSNEIQQIRSKKSELRLSNEILNSKIDAAKTLTNLSDVEKKLGLVEKRVNYIESTNTQDVALNNIP